MASQRALIIDNNVSLAETVAEILAESGFEVEVACSGLEALVVWRRRPANVVVLDVDLPDIEGVRLARRLARRAEATRLVVMSAGEPERLLRLCEELGAEFLAKPFSPGNLLAAIKRMLDFGREERPEAAPRAARRLLGPRQPMGLLQHSRRQ